MAIRKFIVPVTTAADGSATAYTPYFSGKINQIGYKKTDFADGVDFAITVDGTAQGVWSESDVNAAVVKAPRIATTTIAGVASLYASGGTAVNDRIAVARDRIKIVIAQGGNAKSGTFEIVTED
jgi:hypothetical protein